MRTIRIDSVRSDLSVTQGVTSVIISPIRWAVVVAVIPTH